MQISGRKILYALAFLACFTHLSAPARAEEFAAPEMIAAALQTEEPEEKLSEERTAAELPTEQEKTGTEAGGEPSAPVCEKDGEVIEENTAREEIDPPAETPIPEAEVTEEETRAEDAQKEKEPAEDSLPEAPETEEEAEPENGGEEPENGIFSCGSDLFWTVSEDGTELIFTGSGDMETFENASAVPWATFKETVTSIVFTENITGIAPYAFSGFAHLAEITLPAGVLLIGEHAFENCGALVSVTFLGERPVFGEDVFAGDTLTVYYPAGCLSWAEAEESFEEGIVLSVMEETQEEAPGQEEEKTDEPEEEPFFPEIRLNTEYIRLDVGEQFSLTAELTFETEEPPFWSVTGDAVSVYNGLVTAETAGIAYITVSASFEGTVYTAVCCAEVIDPAPVSTGFSDVRLITASTAVELFRTEYACIRIFPVLSVSMSLDSDTESIDMSTVTVEKAAFTNEALDGLFTLRVKDNETLEIVPTAEALRAAKAGSREIKGIYVTGITVTAGGREFTPYESIRLKIKRSKPVIKADQIVFNSYPTELGKQTPLSFTGGTVTSCFLINDPPSWLEFDPTRMTAGLSSTYIPDKYTGGKLVLSCEVEGWCVPASVTVRYSGKCYTPKITFSEKNVTLFAGTGDTARIRVKVTPGVYSDETEYPVTLTGIERKTGSGYVPAENGEQIRAVLSGNELCLTAPLPAEDGEEHIYRVLLTVLDKEFTCAVRVPAPGIVPKPSLNTSGSIDPNLAGSTFVITPVKKNFHEGCLEEYDLTSIGQYKGKTLVNEDVSDLFFITRDGGRFLLREKTPGTIPAGYTYRALITLRTAAGEASSFATVKISATPKEAAVKVSLQTEGSLIPSDPSSRIILTPSVRPRRKEEELSLVFFKRKDGRSVELAAKECPFTVEEQEDGTFLILLNGETEKGALYYAQLRVSVGGKVYASKTVKLSVKH